MILLFLGPPGSGKGTQSQLLQKKLNIPHLSTGDMFRKAIGEKTAIGLKAKEFMDRGEYVPDPVVIDIIGERIQASDCAKGFILDGFPRTEPQAVALDQLLAKQGKKLTDILNFNIDEAKLIERLSSRRTCRACNKIVPNSEVTAARQSCAIPNKPCDFYQRPDDLPEVIQKRMEVYATQTKPLVQFYQSRSGYHEIQADRTQDQVFQQSLKCLGIQ